MWGSRDPVLEFRDPSNISRTFKAKTSNFALIQTAVSSNEENAKFGQKATSSGHETKFWNFGNRLVSRERLKPQNSNWARTRKAVSSNEQNAKLGQKGSCGGHVTQFWNFGTP